MNAFGFLNINKPVGMTSHNVVARLRRALRLRKLGHAGTLDPLATGVLVLCVGQATRLSEYVMRGDKRYLAVVRPGVSTNTYDAEGEVLDRRDASGLQREAVMEALDHFRGELEQLPPMYSAVKQDGRKLYELARAGVTVTRRPRRVTVHALELVDWTPPTFTLELTCSAGTYVRSLAHALGQALGTGAHLAALTRTASGAFRLQDATTPDDLLARPDWRSLLVSAAQALPQIPALCIDETARDHLLQGRAIARREGDPSSPLAQALNPTGSLLAIVEGDASLWRPRKVFPPQ
ncbi:MAG: tRNA pseudouridine(55) synthase TruB [Anaerolineaceae bacterium]|nr:tRNA pseudouridine(55) synthase TruB [Anaerolineaceae bacterium]